MGLGIYAEKVGMSQLFLETGERVPVTLLKVKNCKVIDRKTSEKHGYESIVVGFDEVSAKKLNKPQLAALKKQNLPLFKYVREFRGSFPDLEVGSELSLDQIFSDITHVDVVSVSKGKGFAGVMKRHSFGGLRASHGVSISHRSHGSTGNMRKQGKVFKGKKMAGHLGDNRVTVHNLRVMKIDSANNLFIVKGCVPGCTGALTRVIPAIKK